MNKITTIIFDWGDTLMRDYPELSGPMCSWEHVEIISDSDLVVKELSKKNRLLVAANADESNAKDIEKALNRVGLDKYFDFFFSSKDLKVKKPNPEFFNKICHELKISPFECIMIGNSYEKDIVGAKEVGMKTIFFNEKNIIGNYPMADFCTINMTELIKIIEYKI